MREQARKLLIQGKNAQAQKLLDTLLRKQYAEAFACLSAVEKKSAEQAARTKRIQK